MAGRTEKVFYRVKWSFLYRLRKQAWYHRLFFRRLAGRKTVKLHIGCGYEYLDGWINIDLDKRAKADLYMDVRDICRYCPENSVDELRMIHLISYLRFWEALDFLQACHRWLKPEGRIVIEIPDLRKAARELLEVKSLENSSDYARYMECVRAIYAFGMDQIASREKFGTYAFGWSSEHLALEMKKAGFHHIRILEPQCHGNLSWRDFRIEAEK